MVNNPTSRVAPVRQPKAAYEPVEPRDCRCSGRQCRCRDPRACNRGLACRCIRCGCGDRRVFPFSSVGPEAFKEFVSGFEPIEPRGYLIKVSRSTKGPLGITARATYDRVKNIWSQHGFGDISVEAGGRKVARFAFSVSAGRHEVIEYAQLTKALLMGGTTSQQPIGRDLSYDTMPSVGLARRSLKA